MDRIYYYNPEKYLLQKSVPQFVSFLSHSRRMICPAHDYRANWCGRSVDLSPVNNFIELFFSHSLMHLLKSVYFGSPAAECKMNQSFVSDSLSQNIYFLRFWNTFFLYFHLYFYLLRILMACGQGSTIKGIPDNVREHITIVGSRADVKFDTLSRKKIPQELYDNEGKRNSPFSMFTGSFRAHTDVGGRWHAK